MPDRQTRMTRGYVYYLDGAGGGGLISNWSGGLRDGLRAAGYNGAGEMFRWQTGLGVAADQVSSESYKRSKAAELARKIQEYRREQPKAPVTLVALSAGTAIAAFTLESLPPTCPVDAVILVGASISSDYELTKALQRVREHIYVFTSEKDSVLAHLVPMAGTADRRSGSVPAAGLRGFTHPPRKSPEMRKQYAKIVYVQWRPEFMEKGWRGGHTDVLSTAFVEYQIAPLITTNVARRPEAKPVAGAGLVPNPDYDRWSRFPEGSYAVLEGHQTIGNVRRPVRVTSTLDRKSAGQLVIERSYAMLDEDPAWPQRVQSFYEEELIKPSAHPQTHPNAKIVKQLNQNVTAADGTWDCSVSTVQARDDFAEWGRDIEATLHQNTSVPGGIVKASLRSHKGSKPFEFEGQLVEWKVAGQ
ncbi:MAG: alpha/beta hydrolase [Phycisphaerae bacterium]|nr:alpha/beta hydrolase [Phycisphaerae bacterium]